MQVILASGKSGFVVESTTLTSIQHATLEATFFQRN